MEVLSKAPADCGQHLFYTVGHQVAQLADFDLRYFEFEKAIFAVAIEGEKAISLPRSTFGGLNLLAEGTAAEIATYQDQILAYLKEKGLKNLIIKDMPSYIKSVAWSGQKTTDLNHHRVVKGPFEKGIKSSKIRQLKHRDGYEFRRLNIEDLENAHRLIREDRGLKNRPVSLSLSQMKTIFTFQNDAFLPFGLFVGHQLSAFSYLVKISKDVAYIFMPAADACYKHLSPTVSLVYNLYLYCEHHHIKYLDYGISSEKGIVNEGLRKFKTDLGFKESEKVTFEIEL